MTEEVVITAAEPEPAPVIVEAPTTVVISEAPDDGDDFQADVMGLIVDMTERVTALQVQLTAMEARLALREAEVQAPPEPVAAETVVETTPEVQPPEESAPARRGRAGILF